MNKTPAVRFIGFVEDWEQRKLGDVLVLLKDGTHGTHKDAESGPLLLSAKNIKNGTIQWDESDRRISEDEYNNIHSNFKLQKGDVLLTIVGSIGETAILSQSKGVTFQRSVAFLRPSDKISSEFLYSEIQGQKFQKALNVRKSTSAQPGIYLGDLGTIPIEFPTSDEEQMQIGSYFQNLDNLITLHQRKYEKLKNIKKSMLEKMFPKNGSNVPEIRFKGFTDAWEQRKLGEMGQTYTGLSGKTKDDFGHGQARFVTYMNVFSNPISNPEMTEPIEIDPKQNEVEVGDVFFTTSSETPEEVGMSSILLEKRGKTYLNSFCFGFRPSEKIDSYYLAYMLRSESTRAKIILLAQGISRYNISKNKVMEIAVSLPSLDEQKMIGQYFSQLDNLITLHHRKLEKLEQIKQAMLHKMFV